MTKAILLRTFLGFNFIIIAGLQTPHIWASENLAPLLMSKADDVDVVKKPEVLMTSSIAHQTDLKKDSDRLLFNEVEGSWYSEIIGHYKGYLRVGLRNVYVTNVFNLVNGEVEGTFSLRGLNSKKLIKGKIYDFICLGERQAKFNYITDGSKGSVKITFSKNFDTFEGLYYHWLFGKFGPWYSKRLDN